MYERSNMFANIECKFKYADEETILDTIKESGSAIINSDIDIDPARALLIFGACFGLGCKGALSKKQKKAIDVFFSTIVNGDLFPVYKILSEPMSERQINVSANLIQLLPSETAIAVLHYILGYAYIDGGLDDERAEFLDSTFGQALLMNFFQSGEEEVPGPFVQLSGLDADIAQYFDENDPLLTFDDVCEQFPDADRDAVKKSLDYLVEEEVLYLADTAVGKMYARLT